MNFLRVKRGWTSIVSVEIYDNNISIFPQLGAAAFSRSDIESKKDIELFCTYEKKEISFRIKNLSDKKLLDFIEIPAALGVRQKNFGTFVARKDNEERNIELNIYLIHIDNTITFDFVFTDKEQVFTIEISNDNMNQIVQNLQ